MAIKDRGSLGASMKGGAGLTVEDVFSTYVYTGNGTSQTIVNGISLGDQHETSLLLNGDSLIDSSDYSHTILNNGATIGTAKYGTGSISLTSSSYMTIPASNAFDFGTDDFTIECWVYRNDSSDSYQTILGFDIVGSGMLFEIYQNQLDLGIRGASNVVSGVTVPQNQWVHLAVTRNNGTIKYFQDGVLIKTRTDEYAAYNLSNKTQAIIGGYTTSNGRFNGLIDDLRVIKGISMYNETFTPPTSSLQVYGGTIAGSGGMVWIKDRSATNGNYIFDTERGAEKAISSNGTNAEWTTTGNLTQFKTDGFTLGADAGTNTNTNPLTSWSFRKAPRFFDMVKYTGNGVAGREIAHDLGCDVGMMIVKATSRTGRWATWHKSISGISNLMLDETFNTSTVNHEYVHSVDSSTFTVTNEYYVNELGQEYIAYLFADDPLGASGDGSDGMIACGSYVGNGLADGPTIELGWEPQYVMVKSSSLDGSPWFVFDTMRGIATSGLDAQLFPNTSDAESTYDRFDLTPTGFKTTGVSGFSNGSGQTYIYMAIRRPMKEPTSSDEVFAIDTWGGTTSDPIFNSGFVTDFGLIQYLPGSQDWAASSRMTGTRYLKTNLTDAEVSNPPFLWDYMDGYYGNTGTSTNWMSWMFKRAKGFFDVVAYTGDGVAGRTVNHNLGVVPSVMWVKCRSHTYNWIVYNSESGETQATWLNSSNAERSGYWNNTAPTDSVFTVNVDSVNQTGATYIAYLFATLAGISKVGSYTGNGTSQTIDCGFTTGAKFIIIKRTDSTGDWFMWDSVRGIVAGNDPHLSLNTTAAEVTTDDSIDPDSSGFIVNQNATTNINVSSATYIYYSIAEGA